MEKLIQGIVDFRNNLTQEKRNLFAELALGQKPDTLFIACSDSRVVPNLFASTNPGDLFVLRNIGNLIPPHQSTHEDKSVLAVVEFAVHNLMVSDIIICGHSECGAMLALINGVDAQCCSHLDSWLHYGEGSLKRLEEGMTLDVTLSRHNQLSQINVLQQLENLMSYDFIAEKVNSQKIRLHGWWFDIAQADVYSYEKEVKRFVLIDEEEANLILARAKQS